MKAVVIGAGVNELVAAHYLARAGMHVAVVDQGHPAEETDTGWMPPGVIRELALETAGLAVRQPDPWVSVVLPDGGQLQLWRDLGRSMEAIRRLSARDAEKWPEFCTRMAQLARVLEALYVAAPPDFQRGTWRDAARLAGIGMGLRRHGRHGVEDLLRVLPIPVADWLDDWFECDALKGLLGAAGVMHLRHGPRASGTAFGLLHRHAGNPAGVFRQPRSNATCILLGMPGIEVLRESKVARIAVRQERVTGVVLAGGEEIAAPLVVSGCDPRQTLTGLVDPGWLDPELVRALRNLRCRGVVARVGLGLDRDPGFSTLVVAPSLDYLERAADDAKYGRISREPYLEACAIPPKGDGLHRVDVHVQYAPYDLGDGGWSDARCAELARTVVERLGQHAPDLLRTLVERSVHSSRDLERVYGYPEGQAYQAELALDQALWMRPVPQLAQYATPIQGLYVCGMATHPGAGVLGASGANAARAVLRHLKAGKIKDGGG